MMELMHFNESFDSHCVKSVRIRSYTGLYFLAFGLNTERIQKSSHLLGQSGSSDQLSEQKYLGELHGALGRTRF